MNKKIWIYGKTYSIDTKNPRNNAGVVREIREALKDVDVCFDILFDDPDSIRLLFLYDFDEDLVFGDEDEPIKELMAVLTGEDTEDYKIKYPIVNSDVAEEVRTFKWLKERYEKNNRYYGGDELELCGIYCTATHMVVKIKFINMKKRKNNKLFLCGFVYDTAQMSADDIKAEIEKNFEDYYHGKAVIADLKIEDNKVELCLQRSFKDKSVEALLPYDNIGYEKDPLIFCIDQDFLLGSRLEGNVCKEKIGGVGFGYYYTDQVSYFTDIYKKNCKLLKVRKPKNVMFKGTNDSITFTLTY